MKTLVLSGVLVLAGCSTAMAPLRKDVGARGVAVSRVP